MRDPGSHSRAAMRIYYVGIGGFWTARKRSPEKNLKKVRRIGRHPETAKPSVCPRRIVVFQPSVILKQRINANFPTTANGNTRRDISSLQFRAAHIDFGVEAYFDADDAAPRAPLRIKAGSAFPRCRQQGRFCYQACEAYQCR